MGTTPEGLISSWKWFDGLLDGSYEDSAEDVQSSLLPGVYMGAHRGHTSLVLAHELACGALRSWVSQSAQV